MNSHERHAASRRQFLEWSGLAAGSAAVFGTLDGGLAKVMRGVKESFDPKAVLNPGRMYAGL